VLGTNAAAARAAAEVVERAGAAIGVDGSAA
jgi:hypothetical protein